MEKIIKIDNTSKEKTLLINFGNSKISLALVELNKPTKELSVLGSEEINTKELKDGFIKNIEEIHTKIKAGITKLKKKNNIKEEDLKVLCSISSELGERITTQGVLNFITEEITSENIEKVIQLALYNSDIPKETKAINYKATKFKVDGVSITNPINMSGNRLEVELDIQTIQTNYFNNFQKVIQQCGLKIDFMQFHTEGMVNSLLTEEEQSDGTILLELGETSSRAVFVKKEKIVKEVKLYPSIKQIILKISQYYSLKYEESLKIYKNLHFITEYSSEEGYFEIEHANGKVQVIELDPLNDIISNELINVFENIRTEIEGNQVGTTYKNGVVFVNTTNFNGVEDFFKTTFSRELTHVKTFNDVVSMNESILNDGLLNESLENLGNLKFLIKDNKFQFDHKMKVYSGGLTIGDNNGKIHNVYKEDSINGERGVDMPNIYKENVLNIGLIDKEKTKKESRQGILSKVKKSIIELW